MRTTSLRATSDLVHQLLRTTADGTRESRDFRRAVKRMPKPMPWEWASPRLVPFLSGPSLDKPGESLVRIRSDIGPMVEFGVDLGGVFTFVDERVAQRWECSPQQLLERSLHNLETSAGRIQVKQVVSGVMSGRSIRLLRDRPRWASSIVLVPEVAFRLFGDHDQFLGTPHAACLVSLPIDTPPPIVAEILVDFERASRRPLWLDPFVVEHREISWSDDYGSDGDTG
jgi:hypothetical protein